MPKDKRVSFNTPEANTVQFLLKRAGRPRGLIAEKKPQTTRLWLGAPLALFFNSIYYFYRIVKGRCRKRKIALDISLICTKSARRTSKPLKRAIDNIIHEKLLFVKSEW